MVAYLGPLTPITYTSKFIIVTLQERATRGLSSNSDWTVARLPIPCCFVCWLGGTTSRLAWYGGRMRALHRVLSSVCEVTRTAMKRKKG